MRTTTHSSELNAGALALVAAACFVGCRTQTAGEFFELSEESPQHRAAQIRLFETRDERELLSASAAVLQDLGFHIEESVREVGFLRVAKEASAREYGPGITRGILAVLTLGYVWSSEDLHQKIAGTLVARPVNEEGSRHEVRVSFYRVVWKGGGYAGDRTILPGEQRAEMIRDPRIYQEFFAKLSKAVFLEAFTL